MFRRKSPPPETALTQVPLEQSCYDIAYFILPHYVFQDLAKLVDLCHKTPTSAGPFLYVLACQARGIEPDSDAVGKFKWHHGLFEKDCQFLALEYPTPSPVDMGDSDPISLIEAGIKIVLAPHFSVILHGHDGGPEYFILGQAPIGGGTTVRQILAEGMNCNLGPGPAPTLDGFFTAIRDRKAAEEKT